MDILQRMRQAVRQQNYRLSSHANDEMADDWLTSVDIEEIIRTGTIADKFTHDPCGIRYEVYGKTRDQRQAYVVCRFLLSGTLLIVTAYAEEGENDDE